MNWTEGNLSRHSRSSRRNQLLARQKQYFAKARNKTFNSSIKQAPISISFIETERAPSSDRRECHARSRFGQASSPLLLHKQKQIREPGHRGDASSPACQEKRKRLLDQSDWAGLSFQQPIEITFPGEIHETAHSRWGKVDHTRGRPARKLGEYVKSAQIHQTDPVRRTEKRPMRIQVGSQIIQPSLDTSSSPPSIRRCSLVPRPTANPVKNKSSQISSPIPSQARQSYVVPGHSKFSNRSKGYLPTQASTRNGPPSNSPPAATRPETPAHVVHSSSIIHEPVPRRADDFMVLQWSPAGSEDRSSLRVEIERPAGPALESANNQSWRNWAANLSESSSPNNTADNSSASFIPLIGSDASLPSHLQVKLPVFEVASEADRSITNLSPEQAIGERILSPCSPNNDEGTQPFQGQDSTRNSKLSNNLNEAWMKFVFDENYESESDIYKKAAHQAALELRPSDTTDGSTKGDETVATCGTDLSMDDSEHDKFPSSSLCDSLMGAQTTTVSESAVSNTATVGSPSTGEPEHKYRFAQPKTFVGRLANESGGRTVAPPPTSNSEAGRKVKGRARRKKRAYNGRTDIRGLPDFDGDPIEEFEEN